MSSSPTISAKTRNSAVLDRRGLGFPALGVLYMCALLLSSCITVPTKPQEPDVTAEYVQSNGAAQPWLAKGKISFWNAEEKRSQTASFEWQHWAPRSYKVRLSSPVGNIAIYTRDGEARNIKMRNKDISGTKDLSSQISRELEFPVPLEQIVYWFRGELFPDGSRANTHVNAAKPVISQLGWQMEYEDFENGLARRITAKHHPYRIRLAITSWHPQ